MKALTITRSPSVMRAGHHALRGAPQHGHQRDGDDELLAAVEHAQRALALQRGAAQLLQALVVAPRLEVLVVEVLHRLVVEQRVDGLAVRHRVEFVHLAPELGAPLGHADGEGHVEHQRGHRDPDEADVELDAQDAPAPASPRSASAGCCRANTRSASARRACRARCRASCRRSGAPGGSAVTARAGGGRPAARCCAPRLRWPWRRSARAVR